MIDIIIIGLLIVYILIITYFFAAEIFLVTLLFFIAAYIAYTVWATKFRKKKARQVEELVKEIPKKEEPKPVVIKEEPTVNKQRIELKDYVKYNIHYGQTPNKVRKALEREGWPKKGIDQAFLDYYAEEKANKFN